MPDTDDIIVVQDVHKYFGSVQALNGVSLKVERGKVVVIIGPSGSGKSTLLRCINHLEVPTSGDIWVDGERLTTNQKQLNRVRTEIGMVFQLFNLFPRLTVLENLIEALMVVQGLPRAEAVARAEKLLDKVGLSQKRDNYPARLSGGQKQRVAIARALAMQPDIMLFDEPTSALDPELTGEVLRTMRELAEERMTMLVVTHEMGFAREVAHRVAFMDQGELITARPAQEFFADPGHERARAFLEHML